MIRSLARACHALTADCVACPCMRSPDICWACLGRLAVFAPIALIIIAFEERR